MESLALYQQAAELYPDLPGAGLSCDRGEYTGEENASNKTTPFDLYCPQ